MKPMLALYGHPFSSYTQKVLTALHENGTPYELRNLDPGAPGQPGGEFPVGMSKRNRRRGIRGAGDRLSQDLLLSTHPRPARRR